MSSQRAASFFISLSAAFIKYTSVYTNIIMNEVVIYQFTIFICVSTIRSFATNVVYKVNYHIITNPTIILDIPV